MFYVLCLVTQSCPTLCDLLDCNPPGSSVRGDSPGKNTGVGCRALLQGIFPIQGSNPGLPHCRWLSHQGSIHIYTHNFIVYFFIHVSTDGYLGCFHVLAIVNSTGVNTGVHIPFQIKILLVKCPEVGLLDHMVSLFLVFWANLFTGFQWWLHQFTFPPAEAEHSLFCTPSPTVICRLK